MNMFWAVRVDQKRDILLTHKIVGTGKSEICKADQQAGNYSLESESSLETEFLPL